MRGLPKSLFGRLLLIATATTLAALVFASFAIGHVLERFVMRGLDDRLDAQVMVLASAVRPDGSLDPARTIALPGFDDPASGWGWQVDGPAGRRATAIIRVDDAPRFGGHEGPRPGEGRDARGERLHVRTLTLDSAAGPVTISASGPRRVVEAPLREAMVPLLGSLALLGLALGAATLVQLRIGLRPLRALQAALGEVIAGRRRHVPAEQPIELAPLAAELNTLIDQNAAGLEHARRHVANLAHGLKTPLAALGVRLAEDGRDPDGSLAAMLASIDRRVVHHLRRARAAAPGGTGRAVAALKPALDDLIAVLTRINADRAIVVEAQVPEALSVAVDPQDLDEMLGNLLDNAWRHARGMIRIEAIAGAMVTLTIADDGPGLDDTELAEALVRGRRLDENAPGHGFGLPITQELAELNGGTLTLARADLGGLCATLALPSGGV